MPARRVVSIGLIPDELLLAIADREQLAGLTTLTNDPAFVAVWHNELREVPRVATGPEPLLAATPDLVIASRWSPQHAVSVARRSGIPLLTLGDVKSIADIANNLRRVGRAIGQDQRAEQQLSAFYAEIEQLRQRPCPHPRRRILLLGSGYAYGASTLQDDWLQHISAVNVAAIAGKGAVPLAQESWLELEPDFILLEIGGTELERNASRLLPNGAVREVIERRFFGRIIGIPRVYSDGASCKILHAMKAVSEIMCRE
jgi:iron complex transport system substrate-binding protein